eukprot:scaffold3305_cov122-Skeletonema_menzelii.AAC.2
MNLSIIVAIIAFIDASSGVTQAHEFPHLRGFVDVFETSDATCPKDFKCRPLRHGASWESRCENCPGMPTCFNFNRAAGGTIDGNHCCNTNALHNAPGGLTKENIEKHCHVPKTEKEHKVAPEPEPTCRKTCRPIRFDPSPWKSGCEGCAGMPDCFNFNGAVNGTIDGNYCCDTDALHNATGGLTKENIEAHCNI